MRYLSCGIPSWWNHAVGCCIINEKYSFDPSILDKCKYSSVFQEIIFDMVGKSFFWNICTSTRKYTCLMESSRTLIFIIS